MLFPSSQLFLLVLGANAALLSAKPTNSAVDQPPPNDHWMGNKEMREWMSQFTPEKDKRPIVTPTLTTTALPETPSTMTPVNGTWDITTTEGLNADSTTTTVMMTEDVTDNGQERFDMGRTESSYSVGMKGGPLDTTTTEGSVLTSTSTRGAVELGLNADSSTTTVMMTEEVTDNGEERLEMDRTTSSYSVGVKGGPLDTTTTEGTIIIRTTTRVAAKDESTVAPSKGGVIVDSTTNTPSIITSVGTINTVFDLETTTHELSRETTTTVAEKGHPGSDAQEVVQEGAIVTKELGFPGTLSSQETTTTISTTTKAEMTQSVVPEKNIKSDEELVPEKRYEESGSPATAGCKTLILSVVMALASLFIY